MQFWASFNYLISFTVYFAMQLLLVRRRGRVKQRDFGAEWFSTHDHLTQPTTDMYAFIFSICRNHCLNIFTLYHSICGLGHPIQRETIIFSLRAGTSQPRVGGPKSSAQLYPALDSVFSSFFGFSLNLCVSLALLPACIFSHFIIPLLFSPVSEQQITSFKKWPVLAAGGRIIEGLYQHL